MLNEPALVLNRNWYPIGTTSVRDAICLIYRAAARVLDPDDCIAHDFDSWTSIRVSAGEPCIRTVRLRIKIPEVIVLTHYDSFPQFRVAFSRRNIYKRDRNRCQYCGARPPVTELTIDHVIPRSRGGRSTWENCVLACLRCNRRKSSRSLAEASIALQRTPKEPRWTPFISIPLAKRKASWEQFISERYWDIELET
ncbi:MAG: HNH endonuclease [Candidatus Eisenbacteria sp.]|nr:HNH endonuclease [Candidatus Eisenbacteria bacterium]